MDGREDTGARRSQAVGSNEGGAPPVAASTPARPATAPSTSSASPAGTNTAWSSLMTCDTGTVRAAAGGPPRSAPNNRIASSDVNPASTVT
jgi:hypothetical protein